MFVENLVGTPNEDAGGGPIDTIRGVYSDFGYLRPYFDDRGRPSVIIKTGELKFNDKTRRREPVLEKRLIRDLKRNGIDSPVFNATSLRKDEWIELDRQVVKAARQRLRAWKDLLDANQFGGFDAMAKMILEHETQSDPGEAKVDMDGLTEGRTDAPQFQLEGLPLPITHSDFWYSKRRLAISRNGGTPLDTNMGEAAGRRVAETIEQTVIGTLAGITYGVAANYGNAPTVYGYTNHPNRVTKTDLTAPTSSNGTTQIDEILAMVDLAYGQNMYGPFMLYISTGYDKFMDNDFKTNSDKTIRQRVREIEAITDVRRLDYLSGDVLILIQMTANVARAINGMPITTLQWESMGGMRLNFKVMAIQVPQIRADNSGNSGIVHATTS